MSTGSSPGSMRIAGGPGAAGDVPVVPVDAIEAPASVSAPPRSDEYALLRAAVLRASTAGAIPTTALAAYQLAAEVINLSDEGCHLDWQLIAAIGRVESDHGRYGGNVLNDDGVATPGIYGIALDGTRNTQKITDTDAGQYDDDAVYDRAVGPMQFIPTTWSVVAVDADGDGQRNPQDIDDAALASAVYLCSGDDDLSTEAGQRKAVYRYNRSDSYVDLVLDLMTKYLQGDFSSFPDGSSLSAAFPITDPVIPARPPAGARLHPETPVAAPPGGVAWGAIPNPQSEPAKPGKPKGPAIAPAPDPTAPESPAATPGTPPEPEAPATTPIDPVGGTEPTEPPDAAGPPSEPSEPSESPDGAGPPDEPSEPSEPSPEAPALSPLVEFLLDSLDDGLTPAETSTLTAELVAAETECLAAGSAPEPDELVGCVLGALESVTPSPEVVAELQAQWALMSLAASLAQ